MLNQHRWPGLHGRTFVHPSTFWQDLLFKLIVNFFYFPGRFELTIMEVGHEYINVYFHLYYRTAQVCNFRILVVSEIVWSILKWAIFGQSGRSTWVKLGNPKDSKWTVQRTKTGRSKRMDLRTSGPSFGPNFKNANLIISIFFNNSRSSSFFSCFCDCFRNHFHAK